MRVHVTPLARARRISPQLLAHVQNCLSELCKPKLEAAGTMRGGLCCVQMQRVLFLVERARAVAELQQCRSVRGASRSAIPHPPRLRARGGAVASAADAGDAPAAPADAAPPPEARVKKSKLRLDALAMEQHPQYSRTLIQSWILQVLRTASGRSLAPR